MDAKAVKQKQLIVKEHFYANFHEVLEYTAETFGKSVAEKFKNRAMAAIKNLPNKTGIYPINRFLTSTSAKTYRNILLNSYYIIYSVTADSITVLDIIYQGRDPEFIASEILMFDL